MRRLVLLTALLVAAVACAATLPAPAAEARRTKPARPAPAPVRYDAALFGPDRPLAEVLREAGIVLDNGRIPGARIDVYKDERRLSLTAAGRTLKSYRVQLGRTPDGAKSKVRDGRTPEGTYRVCDHRAGSKYHRALMLAYPNAEDAARGLASKRISRAQHDAIVAALADGRCPPQTTRLGGLLMIHGQHPSLTRTLADAHKGGTLPLPAGHEPGDGDPSRLDLVRDWTDGCIALLNPDVRELFEFVPEGTPVEIHASIASARAR